jgi:Major Facilitator Superfamily
MHLLHASSYYLSSSLEALLVLLVASIAIVIEVHYLAVCGIQQIRMTLSRTRTSVWWIQLRLILLCCVLAQSCAISMASESRRLKPTSAYSVHQSTKHLALSSNLLHDVSRGGATKTVRQKKNPSFYWAIFHNWMYFLSLGFNLINIPFMIRTIVDGPDATSPSPASIALSGKVESVDKLLTFAGIGLLSALSDKYGRKPLMTWSAIGFMITNLIQANCRGSIASLYLADFIDGCSSCMLPVCQAYVVDCSSKDQRASNLGVFQGLSGKQTFMFVLHSFVLFLRYLPLS